MKGFYKIKVCPGRPRHYLWLLVLFWTLVVNASLMWNVYRQRQGVLEVARTQARILYKKDMIWHQWSAEQGGIYVPVTAETPPNPYRSDMAERDVTTPSGRLLTLIDPFYMVLDLYELQVEQYGIRSHITSLKPIRPQNDPDPWEIKALEAFEDGDIEVSSIENIGDKTYLRLMRPLLIEEICLKYHAVQGYRVGDIRGGISSLVPMSPLWGIAGKQTVALFIRHAMMWSLGIGGIFLGASHVRQHMRERERMQETVKKSENSLAKAQQIAQLGNWDVDIITHRGTMSKELCHIFGINSYEADSPEAILNFIHPDDKEFVIKAIEDAIYANKPYSIDYRIIRPDGTERVIHGEGEVYFDAAGKASGMVGTAQDITERKRAEEQIKASLKESVPLI